LSGHSPRLGKPPARNAVSPPPVHKEEAIPMRNIRHSVFVLGFAMLLAGSAATSMAASLPNKDQSAGPSAPQTVPEDPATSGGSTEPLSDKLNRSGGVIHPPGGVDPEMTQAPPRVGSKSMPVIPPPGTSGSKRGINPK
jgi:hypothetical protein